MTSQSWKKARIGEIWKIFGVLLFCSQMKWEKIFGRRTPTPGRWILFVLHAAAWSTVTLTPRFLSRSAQILPLVPESCVELVVLSVRALTEPPVCWWVSNIRCLIDSLKVQFLSFRVKFHYFSWVPVNIWNIH